jgi:hypothetical protein
MNDQQRHFRRISPSAAAKGTLLAAAALVARQARPAPAAPRALPGELTDCQGEAKQEMTEPNGYIWLVYI